MNDALWGILLLLGFVGFAVLYARVRAGGPAFEETWLPRELRGSELAYSEQKFVSRRHGLVARLDRAYRAGGLLHLVELKTRDYVAALPSDVIELSVQRVVLEEATEEPVSLRGYVAIKKAGTGEPKVVPVALLDEDAVLRLRERLVAVRGARGRPAAPTRRTGACQKCGHAEVCARTYADRQCVPPQVQPLQMPATTDRSVASPNLDVPRPG